MATDNSLSLTCGACQNVICVPAELVVQLMKAKRFSCPHCRVLNKLEGPQEGAQDVMRAAGLQTITTGASAPSRLDSRSSFRHNALNGPSPRLVVRPSGFRDQQLGSDPDPSKAAWASTDHLRSLYGHKRSKDSHLRYRADTMPSQEPDMDVLEEEEEEEIVPLTAASLHFEEYKPAKLKIGCPHPDPVVESNSLMSVDPPELPYQEVHHLQEQCDEGLLSGLQLESIFYACQRHDHILADGNRAGFMVGDGAGVGKGRTIAGLILENVRCGRAKHIWLSTAADLRIDARRDLDDIRAQDVDLHALNRQPYCNLSSPEANVKSGVIFSTYASLISSSDKGLSRLQQLIDWFGPNYDGLIVFDECHKAKNLIPDSGGKPSKIGEKVLELQTLLPQARIVYASATGASEARNLGYMTRLGLWGEGVPAFPDFATFLDAMDSKGVAAFELVAMDMKARGMYVCRTLSYLGATFDVKDCPLSPPMENQYKAAALLWTQLRSEFLYALGVSGKTEGQNQAEPEAVETDGRTKRSRQARTVGSRTWRAFWSAHQRFFRHMCMAAKVPALVQISKQALQDGQCVVIGLQTTGEARTAELVSEQGSELDDFVSGPKELMLKLVEDMYPLPGQADPQEAPEKKPKRGRPGKRAAPCEAGPDDNTAPARKKPSKGQGKGRATKASKAAATSAQTSSESAEEGIPSEAEPALRPPSARVKRRRINAAATADAKDSEHPTAGAKANAATDTLKGDTPAAVPSGEAQTMGASKRSPLIVKLKMPASASKPAPAAATSRRSHRKRAGDKAPVPNGISPDSDDPAALKSEDAPMADRAGTPGGSEVETEEDSECWQPQKKFRSSSVTGKSRLRTASGGGGKGPALGKIKADRPAAPVGSVDELQARLKPSGTELDSQPPACDGPDHATLMPGNQAGARSEATNSHAKGGAAVKTDHGSYADASGAAVKPEPEPGVSGASTVKNEPADGPSINDDALSRHTFSVKPEAKPEHGHDVKPESAVGPSEHMKLEAGREPNASRILAADNGGGSLHGAGPAADLGLCLTAGLRQLHAHGSARPSDAQQQKLGACSRKESAHLSAATPAAWRQLKQDSASASKSGLPSQAVASNGMKPGHDQAALSTPVMSLSKLAESLRGDTANGGPMPGTESKPQSSPADVVELGDSDPELGGDEDADLVFLGETSTSMAAARDPKAAAQGRHPVTTAQGLPEDELVLVASKPGLTPIQLKRRDALTRRKMVTDAICCMDLPSNPLDMLIDQLGGVDQVAEMTGRKARLVRMEEGQNRVKYEARNASGLTTSSTMELINVHERKLFLSGRKLVAVISEAASAGISLHADRRAENQRRRVHLTLELPWSADKAIQQFGRSHRANQTSAPLYRMLFTPLGGEKRFASAVARRLESLGALTQGDRRTNYNLQDYNYDSKTGQQALRLVYKAIMESDNDLRVIPPACLPSRARNGDMPLPVALFYARARGLLLGVGIIKPAEDLLPSHLAKVMSRPQGVSPQCGKIPESERGDISRFLNRLLGIEPDWQRHLFEFYQAMLEAHIAQLRREQKYDDGIVDVKGSEISIVGQPQVVRRDSSTSAATLLYHCRVDRGLTFANACALLHSLAATESPTPAVPIAPAAAAAAAAAAEGSNPLPASDTNGPENKLLSGSAALAPSAASAALQNGPASASAAGQPHPVDSRSGFWVNLTRSGQPGRQVMLAVADAAPAGSSPWRFWIHRPSSGRAAMPVPIADLQSKHVQIPEAEAKDLWDKSYDESGRTEGRVGANFGLNMRQRRIALLAGLVLPVWQVVEGALSLQARTADRRLKVIRLQTTGDDPKRLVGISIPEAALDQIIRELEVQNGGSLPDSGSRQEPIDLL